MERKVVVLCRPAIARGFALAGVSAIEASTAEQASTSLTELLEQTETGVVLIDEELHDALPDELRTQIARTALPIVVPFAGPAWGGEASAAESYVAEILRQAVGYRVRLR